MSKQERCSVPSARGCFTVAPNPACGGRRYPGVVVTWSGLHSGRCLVTVCREAWMRRAQDLILVPEKEELLSETADASTSVVSFSVLHNFSPHSVLLSPAEETLLFPEHLLSTLSLPSPRPSFSQPDASLWTRRRGLSLYYSFDVRLTGFCWLAHFYRLGIIGRNSLGAMLCL